MLHDRGAAMGDDDRARRRAPRAGLWIGAACMVASALAPLAVLTAFLRDAPPAASGFWLSVAIVTGPYLLSAGLALAALAAARREAPGSGRGGAWAFLVGAAVLIVAGHSLFLARNLVWTP